MHIYTRKLKVSLDVLTVNKTGDSMFDAYMFNYTMEHSMPKLGIPATYVTYREVGEF